MASRIYEQIFQRLIQQFVGAFSEDSTAIFKGERSRLIHPGEYGRYREEACKNILRLLLDKSVNISDGFVITSKDTISTQCDIIVYNSDVAPVVADGFARMFPAEEVRMIAEVKSTLTKSEFKEALRKMAENKRKIIDGRSGSYFQPNGRSAELYNTIGSFLICNKMNFDFDSLDFDEIYKDIDRKYWHNGILGVGSAAIIYALKFNAFPDIIKKTLETNNINMDIASAWQYPVYSQNGMIVNTQPNVLHFIDGDPYKHIKKFFAGTAACCKDIWIYTYDPAEYLGMTIDTIFNSNQ